MPNTPPSSSDATLGVSEDATAAIGTSYFTFIDPDSGSALATVRIDTLPGLGALRLNGSAVTIGQVITAADIAAGRLTYTPPHDASGSAYASFTFSVSDGIDFDPTPNTIRIDVFPIADAPIISVAGAPPAIAASSFNAGLPVQVVANADNGQFSQHLVPGITNR